MKSWMLLGFNFADYFNLSHDLPTMKKQLEKMFQSIKAGKASKKTAMNAAQVQNALTARLEGKSLSS